MDDLPGPSGILGGTVCWGTPLAASDFIGIVPAASWTAVAVDLSLFSSPSTAGLPSLFAFLFFAAESLACCLTGLEAAAPGILGPTLLAFNNLSYRLALVASQQDLD